MQKLTFTEKLVCLPLIIVGLMCLRVPLIALALEIKANVSGQIPLVLINKTNTTEVITGITNETVNITYWKPGGEATALADKTFEEVNATMPGLYAFNYSNTFFNTLGEWVIYFNATTSLPFRKTVNIVANLESDTVTKLGDLPTAEDIVDGIKTEYDTKIDRIDKNTKMGR